jgi:hypothetical protein
MFGYELTGGTAGSECSAESTALNIDQTACVAAAMIRAPGEKKVRPA